MNYAPIAIFIFNRPDHLEQSLKKLVRCDELRSSPVYVFGDGPRSERDVARVDRARAIAREYLGDSAHYRFSPTNRGLADSIISGVSELTSKYGRVIVLEDDLIVSTTFLSFVNEALDEYAECPDVMQVSGYIYPVPGLARRDSALFLPITTTWGWATWNRAWQHFDPDARGWQDLLRDKQLRRRFNLDGSYDYATMLRKHMSADGHSWGIRWYWSVFKRDGLVLFPPQTLVDNIGMDQSGTHGRGFLSRFKTARNPLREARINLDRTTEIEKEPWDLVKKQIWYLNGGWLGKIRDVLRRLKFFLRRRRDQRARS